MDVCIIRDSEQSFKSEEHSKGMPLTLSEQNQNSLNPIELLLYSLASSAGLEALKWLKSNNTSVEKFQIKANARFENDDERQIPTNLDLTFIIEAKIDHTILVNAIEHALYVSSIVAAILSRVVTVGWKLNINGNEMADGIANFDYSLNEQANHLANL